MKITKKFKAFHNDSSIKEALLKQLQAHYDADEIIKGTYWENGKGCAIGCAIRSNDHSLYEERFNIPVWLAKVQDVIFEGLYTDKSQLWPILFTKSVNVGADLNTIKIPFLIFIVESVSKTVDHNKFPNVTNSINVILGLLKNKRMNIKSLTSAASAAALAAKSANYASSAANAANAANYASSAAYAAYAADAASSAASAASAVYAFSAANAVNYAASTAASAAARYLSYEKFADKLIELIVNCK